MNVPPYNDGDFRLYRAENALRRRRVVYINGILTSGPDHMATALSLSRILGAEVLGVYNRTDGGVRDLANCVGEYKEIADEILKKLVKRTFAGAVRVVGRAASVALLSPGWEYAGDAAGTALDIIEFPADQRHLLSNPATQALYNLLAAHTDNWPHPNVSLVAHSEGNLISSCALHVLCYARRMRGKGMRRPVHVYSLASPSPAWPKSSHVTVRTYSHWDDPITWLSLGRNRGGSRTFSNVGFEHGLFGPHDVSLYLKNSRFLADIALDLGIAGVDFRAPAMARA